MLLNKEILVGIYNSSSKYRYKNFTFDISWNTSNVVITAYNPGDPIGQNAFDIPRINTWKSDGTNIVYMSAGYNVWDPLSSIMYTPWGNRSVGTEIVQIPLSGSLSAGVDFFTVTDIIIDTINPPLSDWEITDTGNPNEKRYRYSVTENSQSNITIFIDINRTQYTSNLWTFVQPACGTKLNSFTIKATTNDARTIGWGDGTETAIITGVPLSHTYILIYQQL